MANAPGTTSFDVDAARKAGYSDAEIADELGRSAKFDAPAARQMGYSDAEIIDHLTQAHPLIAKPSVAADIGKSALEGGRELAGTVGDAALSPMLGAVQQTLGGAANVADVIRGKAPQATRPFSGATDATAKYAYQPQTGWGELTRTAVNMLPGAAAPGGLVRRAAAVILPTLGAEGAGQTANALGGGPQAQAVARFLGGVAGGGAASARVNRLAVGQTADEQAANVLARVKPDLADMQARANAFSDAGVAPTLIDVAGNRGQRLARAVGVKNDQAGETLQSNARAVSATTKPAVMAATQDIGPSKGTTADQATADLRQARTNQANQDYAGPYQTQVALQPETVAALSDEHGRAALRQARAAASARMDQAQVGELDALLKMNPPPDSVSAGSLDRVRIAMRNRASAMAQNNRGDVASGLRDRVGMIDQTLSQVPEIQPARANYQKTTQAIDVLGKGRKDVFATDPADYAKWESGLSDEARAANQVAIRQEILDTLGGQRSSTLGSLDELASSPYARANLQTALGPEADRYLAHVQARLDQARNASFVSPNAGSRTAVLENDLSGVKKGISAVASAARGDVVGLAGKALDWLMTRGVSQSDARAFAQAAVDPARTSAVLSALEARYGRPMATQFLTALKGPALIGAGLGTMGLRSAPAAQPDQSQ